MGSQPNACIDGWVVPYGGTFRPVQVHRSDALSRFPIRVRSFCTWRLDLTEDRAAPIFCLIINELRDIPVALAEIRLSAPVSCPLTLTLAKMHALLLEDRPEDTATSSLFMSSFVLGFSAEQLARDKPAFRLGGVGSARRMLAACHAVADLP
jgi:hypothetical protein